MSKWVVFPDLGPAALLDVLRLVLHRHPEAWREAALAVADRGPLGVSGSLYVTEAVGRSGLEMASGKVTGLRLEAVGERPAEAGPLGTGLLQLVRPVSGASEWVAEPNERMFVGRMPVADAAEIFGELNLSASALRVAVGSPVARAGAVGSDSVWLFHLRDEGERGSTVSGSLAAGQLARLTELAAYSDEGLRLFCPRGTAPDRGLFRRLRGLVEAVPELLGALPSEAVGPWLAWMRAAGEGGGWDALSLGGLRFQSAFTFTGAPEGLESVKRVDLRGDEEARMALRREILGHGDQGARQLRLVADPVSSEGRSRRGSVEAERFRLQTEITRLQRRMSSLDMTEKPKPMVLRFGSGQLEALVDWMSSLAPAAFHGDYLRYAFQADERDPAGWHYLWVDKKRFVSLGLDPLSFWEEGGGQRAIRFVPDAGWQGRDLGGSHAAGSTMMMFVPKGFYMQPDMGAWSAKETDLHVRSMIANWREWRNGAGTVQNGKGKTSRRRGKEAGSETDLQGLPEKALVLAEPGEGDGVQLTILDLASFEALENRVYWLNELLLVTRALPTESLVSALAGPLEAKRLIDEQRVAMKDSEAVLAGESDAAEARLRQVVDMHLLKVSEQVDEAIYLVDALELEIQGVHQKAESLLTTLGQEAKELDGICPAVDAAALRQQFARAVELLEGRIAEAQKIQLDLEERAALEVRQLASKRKRAIRAIRKLLLVGGRNEEGP